MEKLVITIECGGAAFKRDRPEPEVSQILHDLADSIENGGKPAALFDHNRCRAGAVVYE